MNGMMEMNGVNGGSAGPQNRGEEMDEVFGSERELFIFMTKADAFDTSFSPRSNR